MKLSKAIKKLTDLERYSYHPETEEALTALRLGIEALKKHQLALAGFKHPERFLLPGETPE